MGMINIIKGKIMKYFILTLITLASLFMFASCGVGLFSVTEADKVEKLVAQRYGGLYVFDRKLRDEIIQREKEREEYEKSRLKAIESKKEKLLRDFFTEKEIQDFKDMLARDRKRGAMVDYSHYDVYKKENEILEKLNEKYPNVDEKFPKILSNGCEYVFARDEAYREEFQPYYQKIKEYMGEEVFKKLKNTLELTSFCKKDEKRIPITIYTSIVVLKRTYGNYLLDDTAKGFYKVGYTDIAGDNIFYLEKDKFIKNDEKSKGIK